MKHKAIAFVGTVLLMFNILLSVTSAQTINVLIVGDTKDKEIGGSVKIDVMNLAFLFETHIPKRQLNLKVLSGGDVTKRNILRTINRFNASSSDAMVFLWTGHGAYNRNGHYFHMPNGERLYRSTVVEAIRKQGAGMDAVISDCCNVYLPLEPGLFEPAVPEPPRKIAPLFKSLFLETHGLIDMNGASEGEYGFGDPEDGGTFMRPLCEYLYENSQKSLSWNTLIAQIRPKVQAAFKEVKRKANSKGIEIEGPRNAMQQTTQSVRVWHLPPGWPPKSGSSSGNHSSNTSSPLGRFHPEAGDVIVEVNGTRIRTRQDCINAVKRSPEVMEFVARGKRTGKLSTYRTRLRSNGTRFGISLADTGGNGAKIISLRDGYPCKQCKVVR